MIREARKNAAKEILMTNEAQGYLEREDIKGLYSYANGYIHASSDTGDVIGAMTYLLSECGIDMYSEISRIGYVPDYFCCDAPIPNGFVSNGHMALPKNIESLGKFSFGFCRELSYIDIRHIKKLSPGCFDGCELETVLLGEDVVKLLLRGGQTYVDNIFAYNNIFDLVIPAKYFDDNDVVNKLHDMFTKSEFSVASEDLGIGSWS